MRVVDLVPSGSVPTQREHPRGSSRAARLASTTQLEPVRGRPRGRRGNHCLGDLSSDTHHITVPSAVAPVETALPASGLNMRQGRRQGARGRGSLGSAPPLIRLRSHRMAATCSSCSPASRCSPSGPRVLSAAYRSSRRPSSSSPCIRWCSPMAPGSPEPLPEGECATSQRCGDLLAKRRVSC
jgi:hypothetical protein